MGPAGLRVCGRAREPLGPPGRTCRRERALGGRGSEPPSPLPPLPQRPACLPLAPPPRAWRPAGDKSLSASSGPRRPRKPPRRRAPGGRGGPVALVAAAAPRRNEAGRSFHPATPNRDEPGVSERVLRQQPPPQSGPAPPGRKVGCRLAPGAAPPVAGRHFQEPGPRRCQRSGRSADRFPEITRALERRDGPHPAARAPLFPGHH